MAKKGSKKKGNGKQIQFPMAELAKFLLLQQKKEVSAAKKVSSKGGNPRDGRVKKGAPDEPAEFEPGSARGPVAFDAKAIAEELDLHWIQDSGEKYVRRVSPELWSIYTEKKVKILLKRHNRFIRTKARDDEGVSEVDQVLMHVMEERWVDGIMSGLAGYPSGVHDFPGGDRVIVRRSPQPVKPVRSEKVEGKSEKEVAAAAWPLTKLLIEGRLNLQLDGDEKEEDQSIYFHAWLRGVLRSLLYGKPGSWTQRMVLCLVGPVGCGKSRLQMLVNWLLGERSSSPKAYLTGEDNFNSDMIRSEHQKMEELDQVSKRSEDRLRFSEALKAMVANEGVRARLMRADPTTIYPFWAATLSFNNDPDKMLAFPPLTRDLAEKVLMLLVRKAPLPMPTETDEEKEAFNTAVKAELPAYVHWLLEHFQLPEAYTINVEGQKARYGVRDYQHPSLAIALYDDTPSAELMSLIDEAVFTVESPVGKGSMTSKLWDLLPPWNRIDSVAKNAKRIAQGLPALDYSGVWEGSAADLEKLLTGEAKGWECSMAREARKLFVHNGCTRLLSRLKEDQVDRVDQHRTKTARYWKIARPPLV